MKYKLSKIILFSLFLLVISANLTYGAERGNWIQIPSGQWYYKLSPTSPNANSDYIKNRWAWIADTTNLNIEYCYYFFNDGVMAVNCITPDGYSVDNNGRWVVNGTPQYRYVNCSSVPHSNPSKPNNHRKPKDKYSYKVYTTIEVDENGNCRLPSQRTYDAFLWSEYYNDRRR